MKDGELDLVKDHGSSATVGFSPTPTLYRLHWQKGPREGVREYVHCGADLLLSGLNGDLDAEAKCPVCGTTTRLLIVDGKLDGLEPPDALLHVVEMPTESGRIWIECESTHIFDKKSCFENWMSNYHGKKGLVTSIEEYQKKILERKSASRHPPKYAPLREKEVEQ